MLSERRILVDTSTWIEAMRGGGRAAEALASLTRSDRVVTCDLVIAELLAGALAAPEHAQVRRCLEAVRHVATPDGLGWRAGEIARALRGRDKRVPATDLLIAATAEHYGLVLAHCDRHYETIAEEADLELVRIPALQGSDDGAG